VEDRRWITLTPNLLGIFALITLWSVDGKSTARLMLTCYEHHLLGDAVMCQGPVPSAQALCRAQLWLRDEFSFESTYHWAAVAHYGVRLCCVMRLVRSVREAAGGSRGS
jgi:hypothetical protein